jgi:phosphoribulokinase
MAATAPSRPLLIGIVGDSGSGKTTLSARLTARLHRERVAPICLDDYHRYDRAERRSRGVTALSPAGNRLDMMAEHLALLRSGAPITKPVYDHRTGTFGADETVVPREIVIARGLLGLHTEALVRCFDLAIFLDPDAELRVRWKIARDCARRGYSVEEVRAELLGRRGDAERYIMPQRERADLVIGFYPRPGVATEALGMRVIDRGHGHRGLAAEVLEAAEQVRHAVDAGPFPTEAADTLGARSAPERVTSTRRPRRDPTSS